MELLDCVAAKFHEEPGVFKLLVNIFFFLCLFLLFDIWRVDSGLNHGFVSS